MSLVQTHHIPMGMYGGDGIVQMKQGCLDGRGGLKVALHAYIDLDAKIS